MSFENTLQRGFCWIVIYLVLPGDIISINNYWGKWKTDSIALCVLCPLTCHVQMLLLFLFQGIVFLRMFVKKNSENLNVYEILNSIFWVPWLTLCMMATYISSGFSGNNSSQKRVWYNSLIRGSRLLFAVWSRWFLVWYHRPEFSLGQGSRDCPLLMWSRAPTTKPDLEISPNKSSVLG